MEAILKQGEKLAVFNKSLAVQFNATASKDYLITIEELDHDKNLSIQEGKVVFMWCGEWGKQRGSSTDNCYAEFKARFLFPIIAHKKKHAKVKQLMTDLWEQVRPDIRFAATGSQVRRKWANHDEFHEALTQFEVWARTEAGLVLTEPDKYRVAREAAMASGKTIKVK